MAVSDLRLVTLLPTENQTIYAFNVDNPKEFYSESFFAKMGTTWAFCVVPDRINNEKDYYLNIVQSDNQVITVNTIIPDVVTLPEFRAGILNYYNSDLSNRYTYTITYQQIRVFATAISKTTLDVEYAYIEPIQVDHQLILIVNESNQYYSYGVNLPVGSKWKAIMIVEAGFKPGHMLVKREFDLDYTELSDGEIVERYVDFNTTVTATAAKERYTVGTMKVGLFDNSTTEYSNSDGYIKLGIGTDVNKRLSTILLYEEDKIEGDKIQFGSNEDSLLFAALGSKDEYKATDIIYKTATQSKRIMTAINGYYGYDYILGYAQVIPNSTINPNQYSNGLVTITIRAFGFCCKTAPVNDISECFYFLVIDKPEIDRWTYIKIMIFDGSKKIFSMIASKEYFEEINSGRFIGQYIYKQGSKNGINDSAYLFIKSKFESARESLNKVNIGVYVY